jgi:Na+-driven multidrug efflux pump
MRVAWRWVVLATLMMWVGGFTFYTAIVVPLGTEQLGGIGQGFITREVTRRINIAASIALVALLLDQWVTADPLRARRWGRLGLWLLLAGSQVALFVLHGWLDSYLDPETQHIEQRPSFYQWHRLYLWLHTGQWFVALFEIGLMLAAWRAADRAVPRPERS